MDKPTRTGNPEQNRLQATRIYVPLRKYDKYLYRTLLQGPVCGTVKVRYYALTTPRLSTSDKSQLELPARTPRVYWLNSTDQGPAFLRPQE